MLLFHNLVIIAGSNFKSINIEGTVKMAYKQNGSTKSGNKSAKSAKNKAKSNLVDFTIQLASLGNLQQAIVRNMQKELGNLD